MRYKIFSLFVIVLVCAFSAAAQTVVESRSAIVIKDRGAAVSLAVESDVSGTVHVSLELLDKAGTVRASTDDEKALVPGKNSCDLLIPIDERLLASDAEIAWYRLRYKVGGAQGILSFSQLVSDLFEIRAMAFNQVAAGTNYHIRTRAVNPFTFVPQPGVAISVAVSLEVKGENKEPLDFSGSGVTDSDGFASFDFPIPVQADLGDDGSVTVTGRKEGVARQMEESLTTLDQDVQFLMLTDKPIYQPDQMINVRGILLKGIDEKMALSKTALEFRVTDEDDTVLYREEVATSAFGIAACSWRIPSNAKLGSYKVEVRNADDDTLAMSRIKVSRYDLPNFTVTAKAAKPYYVPGENTADVEVNAAYLFGKPVASGHVRVVEEKEREWNWKEQKYDIEEGQVKEGDTDADGKFHALFDLKEKHDDLKDNDSRWKRFEDVHFAAYFTDSTTNRTEQRRFDIRVTREPIHVYIIRNSDTANPGLPVRGYVTTFYADGTPAQCDVIIQASVEDQGRFKTVGHLRTNSIGAARLVMTRPKIGDVDDNLDVEAIASDRRGRRGTRSETFSFDEETDQVEVATDKTIYKPGDTIHVTAVSSQQTGPVFVEIQKGTSIIESSFATLRDGRAQVDIPYRETFKGALGLDAAVETSKGKVVGATHGILFPAMEGITVSADFDKSVYKPNEQATVSFGVTGPSGGSLASALGIVVVDQAVEERARTDNEFGDIWGRYAGFLGYGESLGGVNLKDLNDLDTAKPISDEMQLAGEIILRDRGYYGDSFHSKDFDLTAKEAFANYLRDQFAFVKSTLDITYQGRGYLHPTDDKSLRDILSSNGVNFDKLRDPWGIPYRTSFAVSEADDTFAATSAGPDRMFETADDFEVFSASFKYFTPVGKTIDAALQTYHQRTGKYILDQRTLLAELSIRQMPDRFGRPYRLLFEPESGSILKLRIRSAGHNGRFEHSEYSGDDFDVWTSRQDVFEPTDIAIRKITHSTKTAPMNESEFRRILEAGGVHFDKVRDAYGRPVYVNVAQRSRYWDKVTLETVQNFGEEKRSERRVITPVTQKVIEFDLRSRGRDGEVGTGDDSTLTDIVYVLSEEPRESPKRPTPATRPVAYNGSDGAITGVVADPNGAVVPNATVTATGDSTGVSRHTTTSDKGSYLITGLLPDTYSVKVQSGGFKDSVIERLVLRGGETIEANVVLEAGGTAETVNVSSDAPAVETSSASIGNNVIAMQIRELPVSGRALSMLTLRPGTVSMVTKSGTSNEDSTPRVREYFPETLVWQPEIITDADGKARLSFPMADSITTWKMYAIASTKNGKVGVTQKEVTAFQPFFVDLDPPKFLTEGDEIYLPTQVRNYTDKTQKVDVSMDRTDWFSMLNADKQQVNVAAGDSQNAVFGFKTTAPVKDGKQRVTALAQTDSDAIEKPVTVRPNGQEIVHTDSDLFTGDEKIPLSFPLNALPKTQKAELKIYPNLYAQISDSIEGLLERPYGCGEQTISSTYPNLMILKFVKPDSAFAAKAKKYLQKGYERLLGYQVADGGFSYWGGKDSADIGLTAYALRFLTDASSQIDVDQEVVKKAQTWLLKQQHADGGWTQRYRWENNDDPSRAKITTTYVARSLSMLTKLRAATQSNSDADQALKKALAYLKSRNAEIDELYALALFGLASIDAGDDATAATVAKTLESMAIGEGSAVYWKLETNTPFYGWGTAGRVETTALVTQLLIRVSQKDPSEQRHDLINKATLFLLKNKDRYGVWYSTQTTINVLDTFLATLGTEKQVGPQKIDILVNGEVFKTLNVAPDEVEATSLDLTGKVNSNGNNIEVRNLGNSPVMTQLVASHYIDWKDSTASNLNVNQSRAIRLDYKCDKQNAAIMQEVNCSVRAERIGFSGYGMLLAEIGTPPGADVDRESLGKAMENNWSVSHYEILPDRILVYMWANPGGTKFNFTFHPRYGINAQTPASVVYDYYNPEAQAIVEPLRFLVK